MKDSQFYYLLGAIFVAVYSPDLFNLVVGMALLSYAVVLSYYETFPKK